MTLKCYLKWQWIIALPASQGATEFPFQVHGHFLATYPHGLPWREKEKQRDNKASLGGNKWAFASGKRKGERRGAWSRELSITEGGGCAQKTAKPCVVTAAPTPQLQARGGSRLRETLQTWFQEEPDKRLGGSAGQSDEARQEWNGAFIEAGDQKTAV